MDSSWSKLPEELQAEIICRLPENVMIGLKLVSRDWCSLISDICIPRISPPSPLSTFCGFIYPMMSLVAYDVIFQLQLAGYGYYRRFTYESSFVEKYHAKLPFEHNPEDTKDCCNGFLLVVHNGVHYVCNPTTSQFIEIPVNPDQESGPRSDHFASLVFDPSKSLHFKIISIPAACVTNPLKVEIFSSDMWEWSSQLVPVDDKLNGVKLVQHSVYLNGVVYRMLMAKYLLCMEVGTTNRDLEVRAIELPKDDLTGTMGAIGTSRGCMYYSNSDESRLLIWMRKVGVGWVLKHSVAIDELREHLNKGGMQFGHALRGRNCIKFYSFHPNCDEIFLVNDQIALRYHFVTKSADVFLLMLGSKIHLDQFCFFPYSRCPIVLNLPEARMIFSSSSE